MADIKGTSEVAAVAQLCFAAAHGQLELAASLVTDGVDVNVVDYDRRSAIHIAAAEGQLAMVEFLISSRADVNLADRWGHTPLEEALRGSFEAVAAALRRAGAKEATPAARAAAAEGHAALQPEIGGAMLLCCAAAAGSLPLVQELHAKGHDLNLADYDGRTALHVAAAHGHLELVEWLVSNGAHVNAPDSFGLTPLAEAMRVGHEEITKRLLGSGADDADVKELRLEAQTGHWSIPASELEVGEVLGKTLKSIVYRATWRGTQVVAKTSMALAKGKTGGGSTHDPAANAAEKLAAEHEMLHEIHLLAMLRHPDLVMFLGACFDHETPFFITEFMEGGDLERYYMAQANKSGYAYRPPCATLMKWTSAVARALSFLHGCSRPIIHRDLKPLNLLLNASQELKVTDFGISKLMAPRTPDGKSSSTQMQPQMSGGVGTWRYMAPEVVRYEQYTDRVDIYSFALIMWFMSTGCQPFVEQFGPDAELVLKDYLKGHEPRPNISHVSAGRFAPDLRQLIQDCWHAEPSRRPSAYDCTQRLATSCAQHGAGSSMRDSFRLFGR